METVSEERFVFEAEWFDAQADLIRKYLLTFYPKDSTIEMVSQTSHPLLTPLFSTTAKTNACSSRGWPAPN
jgi:hypothetical protein